MSLGGKELVSLLKGIYHLDVKSEVPDQNEVIEFKKSCIQCAFYGEYLSRTEPLNMCILKGMETLMIIMFYMNNLNKP